MQPLKQPENSLLCDPSLVDEIFDQIPELLEHHEQFLEQVRHCVQTWHAQQKVGTLLVQSVSVLAALLVLLLTQASLILTHSGCLYLITIVYTLWHFLHVYILHCIYTRGPDSCMSFSRFLSGDSKFQKNCKSKKQSYQKSFIKLL